jgi:hypothetical protein
MFSLLGFRCRRLENGDRQRKGQNMNTLLYIGLGLLALGFLLFVVSTIMISHYDRKLWELKERNKYDVRF